MKRQKLRFSQHIWHHAIKIYHVFLISIVKDTDTKNKHDSLWPLLIINRQLITNNDPHTHKCVCVIIRS